MLCRSREVSIQEIDPVLLPHKLVIMGQVSAGQESQFCVESLCLLEHNYTAAHRPQMKRRSAQKRLGALLTAEAATHAAASNEYIHIFIHAL